MHKPWTCEKWNSVRTSLIEWRRVGVLPEGWPWTGHTNELETSVTTQVPTHSRGKLRRYSRLFSCDSLSLSLSLSPREVLGFVFPGALHLFKDRKGVGRFPSKDIFPYSGCTSLFVSSLYLRCPHPLYLSISLSVSVSVSLDSWSTRTVVSVRTDPRSHCNRLFIRKVEANQNSTRRRWTLTWLKVTMSMGVINVALVLVFSSTYVLLLLCQEWSFLKC